MCLQRLFPHRTLEAIKGVKRKAEYKELLLQIQSSQGNISIPMGDNNDLSARRVENNTDERPDLDTVNNEVELFWKDNG